MKQLITIIFFGLFCQANTWSQDNVTDKQNLPSDKILIINSFDAGTINARKNKKALFIELSDSLKSYLAAKITALDLGEPVIIDQLIQPASYSTSMLDSLLKVNNSESVIVIKTLEVFFENSGETVEKNSDGKREKTIRYDLCTRIMFVYYKKNNTRNEPLVEDCEFFTDRNSSGTFSFQFGPDIVGKKKHAYKAVKRNAEKFVINELYSKK
jgi:phosphohistidine swiveling domain-containing protein